MSIDWEPTIGDPSVLGWFTVFAYASAAAFAAFTARRIREAIPKHRRGRQEQAWWVMSLFLVVLAINKQLDLQSLVTEVGRVLAKEQGWYENRRGVQLVFVILMLGVTGAALGTALYWVRGQWREYGWLCAAAILTFGFIVIRAAGFHHFEALRVPGGVRVHRVLELVAIGLTHFAAVRRLLDLRSSGK